jgi:hypothetical protein
VTTLPRAATSPELALLRADGQSTRLYLTIHQPATIYTARLAAVPASTDQVSSITYSSGSGTLANVLQDMTLLVGSSAGACDLGLCRIRKDGATLAGTLYIGETSEINWTSNAYLTVVDEFGLWPRHIKMAANGTTPLMDYDVDYTDQNTTEGAIPTPIMGPHAVLWLRGASVSYEPNGSSSWTNDGTIEDWAWNAPGASGVLDLDTATPHIEYDTPGTYRIACTVTNNNGTSFTGYRYVFVVDDTHGLTTVFNLESCAGDASAGGWSFRVTLYDEATQALIRDRALVILHAVDYYGAQQTSLGIVAGCENIVAIGHIAGESITRGAEDKWGSVAFDVQGPQFWFGRMTAFPSGVKDVSDATTPNKWTKFRRLTLNKAWYHFMRWRTTATRMMDIYPNTDTRRHKRLEAPGGQNIWSQLVEIAKRSMLANPCCDRYGRLFCEIDQQLVSDRSSMPIVQALTPVDWAGELQIERQVVEQAALIDLSGVAWNGTAATPFFALAPGHVFKHYGAVEVVDRLMLTDQASTNTLAGLVSAWRNNPYPKIDVSLAANHRLFDLTPYQRLTLAIAAADTPRGLTESLTLIPRSIGYKHDARAGVLLTEATFEAEVVADLAVTGDTPPDPPDPPIVPVEPPIEPPPIDPPLVATAYEVWFATSNAIYWSGDYFNGGQPTWNKVAGLPADLTLIYDFRNTKDGSLVYLCGESSTSTLRVWKCADPKVASPTWIPILTHGDVMTAGRTAKQFYTFNVYGSSLAIMANGIEDNGAYRSTYNGSVWSAWVYCVGATEGRTMFLSHYISGSLGQTTVSLTTNAGGVVSSWAKDFGTENSTVWQNDLNSIHYVIASQSGVLKVINCDTGAVLTDTAIADGSHTENIYPRGALGGPHVYFVTYAGYLFSSSDGSAFTNIATWLNGWVQDASDAGGGSLFWLPKTVLASDVLSRLYTQAGVVIPDVDGNGDRTGNFWSLTTGNQTITGTGLVYA